MRMRISQGALCALALLGFFWTPAARGQLRDPTRLESGLIAGTQASDPSVRVYKGVPYAAPPVGDLRWRPPRTPHPWQGVRQARAFAPGCVQEVAGSRLPWTEAFMHQGEVSEDCLYLNVWTAAKDASERSTK